LWQCDLGARKMGWLASGRSSGKTGRAVASTGTCVRPVFGRWRDRPGSGSRNRADGQGRIFLRGMGHFGWKGVGSDSLGNRRRFLWQLRFAPNKMELVDRCYADQGKDLSAQVLGFQPAMHAIAGSLAEWSAGGPIEPIRDLFGVTSPEQSDVGLLVHVWSVCDVDSS
jgi:hypothetical protein